MSLSDDRAANLLPSESIGPNSGLAYHQSYRILFDIHPLEESELDKRNGRMGSCGCRMLLPSVPVTAVYIL